MVITGLGALSGPCAGADALWDALTSPTPGPTHRRLVGFDPRTWLDRRAAQRTSRFSQAAVAAYVMARDDAGAFDDDPEAVGIVMALGSGAIHEIVAAHQVAQEQGPDAVSLLHGVVTMTNAAAANVAFTAGAKGPTYALASGCASGTHAVADALHVIRSGRADVVWCGGSETALQRDEGVVDPLVASLRNLRVHTPEDVSRPFDVERQGFVLSEGAAVLRLERLDAARARGARIYAEVLGGANTIDAYDMAQPAPRGEGLQRCMRLALRDAQVEPGDVGHINTHGTGTHFNDQAESEASEDVFGLPGPAHTSTKAITGHPGAAAGALEAVAVALAVHRRLIPQTQWSVEPDTSLTLDVVRGEPRPWAPGIALSNSVGLGGQNGTIALGPAPD
ncbi:beta-ketoacyl-[acyl-carrier-protein] synthase family protein [Aquihabitans daechungensis]|uniref:beta-ketoacyl-[acyl-carrier-protein] synthase family protein n=1 Tax=Aquihabitans daechungensis TaxID=1052257 RepID=UPI003BA10238